MKTQDDRLKGLADNVVALAINCSDELHYERVDQYTLDRMASNLKDHLRRMLFETSLEARYQVDEPK